MHTKLITNAEVSAHQADYLKRLKLSSFFDIMQDGAYKNADDYGYGFYDMENKGLIWVISRIKVVWENDAYFEDKLKFSTWAKGLERLFFRRDYLLESESNVVAKATALWLIVEEKQDDHKGQAYLLITIQNLLMKAFWMKFQGKLTF